jgi:hypothetical protein
VPLGIPAGVYQPRVAVHDSSLDRLGPG